MIGILNAQAATNEITIENAQRVEAQQEIANDFVAGKTEAFLPGSGRGSSIQDASRRAERARTSNLEQKPSFRQQMQDELADFKEKSTDLLRGKDHDQPWELSGEGQESMPKPHSNGDLQMVTRHAAQK